MTSAAPLSPLAVPRAAAARPRAVQPAPPVVADRAGRYRFLRRDALPGTGDADRAPIVFLHGLLGEPDNWTEVMTALPADRPLLALEYPLTTLPWAETSIRGLIDYTLGFLGAIGIRRGWFVGNSLGGHIALRLALDHTDRVAGMGLLGSSGLFERDLAGGRQARVRPDFIRALLGEIFHNQRFVTDERVEEAYLTLMDKGRRRRVFLLAKDAKGDHLGHLLHEIAVPTVIVWGRQDGITPPAVAREFHAGIARSELHWIDACGHAPQMEHPRAVAEQLHGFVARHERARAAASPQPGWTLQEAMG